MEPLIWLGLLAVPYFGLGIVILLTTRSLRNIKDYSYSPTVTVYVPTFNEEKHIKRKLNTLLSKEYPIKEILIIDCSTDRTVEIIKEYQKRSSFINSERQSRKIGMA